MKFKESDNILCVRADNNLGVLEEGRVYTFVRYDAFQPHLLHAQNLHFGPWRADRFILACGLAKVLYSIGDDSDV